MMLKMHDKNAEEAKGCVAQLYPKTIPFPNHGPTELLPGLHCKFMFSAECRLRCFAYYLSAPGNSTIDH